MEISQLNNLIRSTYQTGLYDMMVFDFKYSGFSINVKSYLVDQMNQMRIDNICNDIYGSTDKIDILMDLNLIDNPLNIMEGDVLFYCTYDETDLFKIDGVIDDVATGNVFLNTNKSTKKDKNRIDYIENAYKLAPTYNQSGKSSVNFDGNIIKLG